MSSALLNDEIQKQRVADQLLSGDDDSDQSDQSDDQPQDQTVTEPLVTEEPEQVPEERLPETPEQQPDQVQTDQPPQEQVQVQPAPQPKVPATDTTALERYNDAGLENFEPAKKEEPQATEPKAEANVEPDLTDPAAPNAYTSSGDTQRNIQGIVIHSSDGSLKSDLSTLTGQDPAHQVSAHYYVAEDGTVHHLVRDNDVAWHAGATTGPLAYLNNSSTIGIEQEHVDGQPWKDSEVQGTAKLVAALMQRHNLTFDQVVGHSDIAPERKQDPLDFPWARFRGYVNNYLTGGGPPQITGQPSQIQAKTAPTTLAEYNDNGLANFEEGPQAQIDENGNIIPATVSGDVKRARPAGLQDDGFYKGENKDDFVQGGVHTFGGAADQDAYAKAKAAGATEAEALAVGDNGVGAPRLGSIDTSNAIGLAIPLDAVKNALGDKPADWRTARVDVVGPNGVRLRLPIVDFGPRDTANTAADLTENASKLFGTTDGKFNFKIVPHAGVDFEKDPDGFKQEQTLLAQGIDPGSQGAEHATFPTTTGTVLSQDELAARQKALADDQQKQKDIISQLPEFTSGSIPGLIKRLEGDDPIDGVSDGMRQAYADSLKQSATAYAQSYYGISDPDEAYKRIMSDANVGTFAGEVFSKIIPNVQSAITAWNKGQAGIDENNLMRFVDIIAPGGTSPDRLMSFKNELASMNPNDRASFLYNMLRESGHATEVNGGPPMDMAKLTDSVNRLLDPGWQAAQKVGIAAQQAQNEKNLQVDPTLKGTAAEWWTGQLAQLPKMTLEGMTGVFGQSLMLSEMYEGALDDAKRQHPDWTEQQLKAQATTSTLMQIVPAEIVNRAVGGKLTGVTGQIQNPVQRILSSTLLHTGVTGGAMTLQQLGKNIAEGKPLDTDLLQAGLSGAVMGAPMGIVGGLHKAPEEEVPRGITEEAKPPVVETPKVETPAVETPPAKEAPQVEHNSPVTQEDVQQRAYQIYQDREANGQPGDALSDWVQAQEELAKKPNDTVTQGESDPWVSSIANRYLAERMANGELGQIIPGEGVSTQALVTNGMQMSPSERDQHVNDFMNNRGGDLTAQSSAVRAKEFALHVQSQEASRIADANPQNTALRQTADTAFKDLTAFNNGPVAKLKNNWHAMGMSMQGEIPIDMSTTNGIKEAYFKDVGRAPDASVEPLLQKTAKQIRDAAAAEKESMAALGAKIDEYTAGVPLAADEEVRNNIIRRMGVEPCST